MNRKIMLWNECQKAASVLDKKEPEWFEKIDTEVLNMQSNCIMMQVHEKGYYTDALRRYFNTGDTYNIEEFDGISVFNNLNAEPYWKRLIKMRKAKAKKK